MIRRTSCPTCRSAAGRELFSRPYADPHLRGVLERFYSPALRRDYAWLEEADFRLSQCGDCGLIYQVEIPDAWLLERLYTAWIDPQEALAASRRDTSARHGLELARAVCLTLGLTGRRPSDLRVLDHGCGWGAWAALAKAYGAEAFGTEVSAERSHHCAQQGIRMLAEKDLPQEGFHVINLEQVLEHVPDPRDTLTRLAAALVPGGILHVAVPNGRRVTGALGAFDREIERPLGGAMHAVAPLQHLNCFTHASLVALAERCGLRRVLPRWRDLFCATPLLPSGPPRQMFKVLARPFYLRSRSATDLHFTKSPDVGTRQPTQRSSALT